MKQSIAGNYYSHLCHLDADLTFLFFLVDDLRRGIGASNILVNVPKRGTEDPNRSLNRQAVANVARQHDVKKPGQYHDEDGRSSQAAVEVLVKKWGHLSNPILEADFVDNKAEDAFLVIMFPYMAHVMEKFGTQTIAIDSTHHVTRYNHYLTTLMVRDQKKEGVPVAFCVSRRKRTEDWVRFFLAVKTRVGAIDCKTFISDGDAAFYNAWKTVMGEPEKRRLCLWHIQKNWNDKMVSFSKDLKESTTNRLIAFIEEQCQDKYVYISQNF